MSNFFDKALTDLNTLEEEILGPNYPYYKYVKSPVEMGMSPSGDKISTNIGGLLSYVEVLVTGSGKASATGGPLGDKYFLKTGAQCKDVATGNAVTRSLYINNVPDGTIPFISNISGESFSELRGLVPGILSDMDHLNPLQIFQAFMMGSEPDCQQITMEVIDTNNISSKETAYVVASDIQNMNPCWFSDNKNPINNATCRETFSNIKEDKKESYSIQDDVFVQMYYGSLGLLGFYIIMKMVTKK